VLTWAELIADRPALLAGQSIIQCGFLYQHEDGTTVEVTP
jgi:hypothetical protein